MVDFLLMFFRSLLFLVVLLDISWGFDFWYRCFIDVGVDMYEKELDFEI